MSDKRRYQGALFTDVDGTWLRWSLFLFVLDRLIALGVLPEVARVQLDLVKQAWRDREESYGEYICEAIRIFESRLDGIREEDFNITVDQAVRQHYKEVYRYTQTLVQEKLHQSWYVCAVSASPLQAVERFARLHGVEHAIGTVQHTSTRQIDMPYIDNFKVFNGERELMEKQLKATRIQAVLDTELPYLGQDSIICVGDTMADLPMLELAGQPICMNPSADLLAVAHQRDWLVITERKNVIKEQRGNNCHDYELHQDGTRRWLSPQADI